MKLIGTLHTEKIVETEKKNRKCETTKKTEVNTIKFMRGVDRADQILHYNSCYQRKGLRNLFFFSLHMAALNSSILLKNIQQTQIKRAKVTLSRAA
jgi:GH24 family phage-related lysozyme (muramidase)